MRIVVLGTRGFPGVQGGVERHCEELYPRLARLGNDVTVITRAPYIPPGKRNGGWRGVKFAHLWCPRKKSFEAITHTLLGLFEARRLKPDILHIHGIGPALLAPAAKTLGLKVVMTHHGPDYKRAKWGRAAREVLRRGEKNGVLASDAVISISSGIREDLRALYGRDSIVIPNGVTVRKPVPPGAGLKRFGLLPGKYIFLACRFVEEKGIHDLIAAYSALKAPGHKLVIAGDADHETEYSRLVRKKAGETEGAVLTGFQTGEALSELFSNASCFVLPSYHEGLPIALLEALSYGLPSLVSDIPAHRELPLSKEVYFKPGDHAALARALSIAMQGGFEPERRKYAALIESAFDWDSIAASTLDVYTEVLKGPASASKNPHHVPVMR